MSANIDEIWASMNEDSAAFTASVKLGTAYSGSAARKKKSDCTKSKKKGAGGEVNPSAVTVNEKNEKKKSKKQKQSQAQEVGSVEEPVAPVDLPVLSYAEASARIARDVQASAEDDLNVRKTALNRLHRCLFVEHTLSEEDYAEVFSDICKSIFKRYADSSEKCRELAMRLTQAFFERSTDLAPVLGYFFPALMQRLPAGVAYDEEMKVFVVDMEQHDAFRRGRAVDRQDKRSAESGGSAASTVQKIVEPSEEIRLLTCRALSSLITRVQHLGACPILHPYFQEMVGYVQVQLNDPFPELKLLACNMLEQLASIEDFEIGMKFFAVGLLRAILPVLRHRHAKVRAAAVASLRACMVVPDRAKRKAAGSEAITDLCGFREENILQISAFYKPDVTINYLAELVSDSSVQVREELVQLLTALLTEIGDRYDHQTRLLPYLLDLMTDPMDVVSMGALACLQQCGREYEYEHEDEVRDRRQYGVDGDDRINLSKPLPAPFKERPRIGMRLYVRGNSKRFLNALVAELTNWVGQTRLKSAKLLKMVVVLCEEHLTMEAHALLPAFIKALKFARDDELGRQQQSIGLASASAATDSLHAVLLEVYELIGRYLAPEVYIYFILPRLRGDSDVVQFGVDAPTRIAVMEFLRALLQGSKPSLIVPHFDELVTALTDPFVISTESTALQNAALDTLITIFEAMPGKGNAVVESHFVATGRITSLQKTVRTAFKYLLVQISKPMLQERAASALRALSELESDAVAASVSSANPVLEGINRLFRLHSAQLLQQLMSEYDIDRDWTRNTPEHLLLEQLVQSPTATIQHDEQALDQLLNFFVKQLQEQPEEVRPTGPATDNKGTKIYITEEHASSHDLPADCELELLTCMAQLITITVSAAVNTNSPSIRTVVGSKLEELLAVFVVDVRWTRSAALQYMRMHFTSLLLTGNAPSDWKPISSARKKTPSSVEDDIVEHVSCGFSNYTTTTARADGIIHGDQLIKWFSPVSNSIFPVALDPHQPIGLRAKALEFMAECLMQLASTACVDIQRVRKFSQSRSGKDEKVVQVLLQGKQAAAPCISLLITALDDGDDSIRLRSVQLLGSPAIAGLMISEDDSKDLKYQGVTFDVVVAQLLQRISVREGEAFVNALNDTMRSICVLDPPAFESIVRAAAPALLRTSAPEDAEDNTPSVGVDGSIPSERMADFVSGLINHVDILQQFDRKL